VHTCVYKYTRYYNQIFKYVILLYEIDYNAFSAGSAHVAQSVINSSAFHHATMRMRICWLLSTYNCWHNPDIYHKQRSYCSKTADRTLCPSRGLRERKYPAREAEKFITLQNWENWKSWRHIEHSVSTFLTKYINLFSLYLIRKGITVHEVLLSLPYSGVMYYITICLSIHNNAFRVNTFHLTKSLHVSLLTCRLQTNNFHRLAHAQYIKITP
jgi:hypothetical protein